MLSESATTEQAAGVDRDHLLALLRRMLLIRAFEERCVELYSSMRIRGFLHLYIGEEAIAAGIFEALRPEDAIVATYREHGHALARGISAKAVMAEMFGKVEGCSRGRGGSMHLFDKATNFYGGSAIVGGGLPLAVGAALVAKMRHQHWLAACIFGDGAVSEGEFHECMNLAALWDLPVLFICENNLYAMGTALYRAQVETNLAARAATYHMPSRVVDGMDVLAVEKATRDAAQAVRGGSGPQFLELRTYRFRAHSMYDPDLYRSKEEIERWRERDPIVLFEAQLREMGVLDDAMRAGMDADVAAEIDAAVAFAEAGTLEPVEDLTRFVMSERTAP
jgi:pyruvate dehydrogenase E1 component subunit alpha